MARGDVRVLIGLDCDRPRQEYAHLDRSAAECTEVTDYLRALLPAWRAAGIGWTMFWCGSFLTFAHETNLLDGLTASVRSAGDGCEHGCHSYSHLPVAPVPGRSPASSRSALQVLTDLRDNARVLGEVFGVHATALGHRTPYGHARGALPSDVLEVIAAQRAYLSSELRTGRDAICPPLIGEDGLRQPHRYACGLWELPSHGWHDTVFAGLSATVSRPRLHGAAAAHYRSLIMEAAGVSMRIGKPIYLGLVLHPQAMARYDPHLRLLSALAESFRRSDIVTFGGYGSAHRALETGRAA